MGFKGQKSIFSLIFFEHTKFIISFEILAYERTKFHKIFIKKYWKLSRWELVFGDALEKSILVVARITRDNFIQNQKIKYFLLAGEYSS